MRWSFPGHNGGYSRKEKECAKTQGCNGLRMGVLFAVFRI